MEITEVLRRVADFIGVWRRVVGFEHVTACGAVTSGLPYKCVMDS